VEASAENAKGVVQALRDFGAPLGLTAEDLETPGTGFKKGMPPARIDVLTKISGVEFAEAWTRRFDGSFGPCVPR